jgi:hypothetical protein
LQYILVPSLNQTPFNDYNFARQFMSAAKLITQFAPVEITIRTMQSLLARFIVKIPENNKIDKEQTLFEICCNEFLGVLETTITRTEYRKNLRHILNLKQINDNLDGIFIFQNLPFPKHHYFIFDMLEQHLKMRDYATKYHDFIYKRVVLLEGPSGIGKSLLLETFIQAKGYTPIDIIKTDEAAFCSQRYYCRITAGNKNIAALLHKAAKAKIIVIIDELNLDHEDHGLAACLDELCSAAYPEFVVYASQNPGIMISDDDNAVEFAGRYQLNDSLKDCSQIIKLSAFEQSILINIAEFYGVRQPVDFVSAFINAAKNNADINMRTFYLDAKKFGLQAKDQDECPPAKRQKLN